MACEVAYTIRFCDIPLQVQSSMLSTLYSQEIHLVHRVRASDRLQIQWCDQVSTVQEEAASLQR